MSIQVDTTGFRSIFETNPYLSEKAKADVSAAFLNFALYPMDDERADIIIHENPETGTVFPDGAIWVEWLMSDETTKPCVMVWSGPENGIVPVSSELLNSVWFFERQMPWDLVPVAKTQDTTFFKRREFLRDQEPIIDAP